MVPVVSLCIRNHNLCQPFDHASPYAARNDHSDWIAMIWSQHLYSDWGNHNQSCYYKRSMFSFWVGGGGGGGGGVGSEAGHKSQQTANKCGVTTALENLCMVCKGPCLCLGYQLCSNDMQQATKLCKHLVCKHVLVNIVQSWSDLVQPSCLVLPLHKRSKTQQSLPCRCACKQ